MKTTAGNNPLTFDRLFSKVLGCFMRTASPTNMNVPFFAFAKDTVCARTIAALVAISAFTPGTVWARSASPDGPLPGDLAAWAAVKQQDAPQIAKGGNGYLAVWTDMRSTLTSTGVNGPFTGSGLGSMTDIYAARLDASGNAIDERHTSSRPSA